MACRLRGAKLWMASCALVVVLAGCGGSGGRSDDNRYLSAELTDDDFYENRYFDVYQFRADEDGEGIVEMRSDDFDAFLIIYRETSPYVYTEVVSNDNGGRGDYARANFPIRKNTRYRVFATATSSATGDYEMIISRNLGQPTLILGNTADGDSVEKMTVPTPAPTKTPSP